MALAVELDLDSVSDTAVRAVWASLEQAGVPSLATATHGRNRPHVSLAVAEAIDVSRLTQPLADLMRHSPPPPFTMASIGVFPMAAADQSVVFLGVVSTEELLGVQAAVAALVDKAGGDLWAHYRAGHWVPHCSLAMPVAGDRLATAVTVARSAPLPLWAVPVSASVVDTVTGDTVLSLPCG